MTNTRRNAYIELFGQWSATALSLVMTVAISRLLTPAEIGLFSVTMAFVVVAQSLQNVGTFEYLIQARELTSDTRRSAYGLSMVATVACAVLLAAISGYVAELYGAPAMQGIILIIAANLLLNVPIAPINAMLVRERRFFSMNMIRVVSAFAHVATAIALAFLGFDAYSLAWGMTAAALANLVMHVVLAREYLLLRPRFRNSGHIFAFGSKAVGAGLLGQMQLAATNLLLGYFAGLGATAMFDRANTANAFYQQGISRAVDSIALAEISATARAGHSVAAPFLATLRYTTAVAWPFFGLMALFAPAVIPVLFGPQWDAAIPVMTVICVASSLWPLVSPGRAVLIAKGRPGLEMRVKAVTLVLRVALIALAAPFGLMAVAYAALAAAVLNFSLSTLAVWTVAPFSLPEYARNLVPSAVVTALAMGPAAVVWSARETLEIGNVTSLAVGGLAAGLGWLVGLRLANHPVWDEIVRLFRIIGSNLPPAGARGRS